MGRWSMYIIAPPLSLASSGNRNLGKIKHQKTCFDLFCSYCRISVKGLYHSFHFSLIFLAFWCLALVFFVVQRPRGSCRKRMGPRRTSMWSSRGNGYSAEWPVEASKRGLPNLNTTPKLPTHGGRGVGIGEGWVCERNMLKGGGMVKNPRKSCEMSQWWLWW